MYSSLILHLLTDLRNYVSCVHYSDYGSYTFRATYSLTYVTKLINYV